MTCPACGSDQHRVMNTRARDGAIWRRRECIACGQRWATYELSARESERYEAVRAVIERLARSRRSERQRCPVCGAKRGQACRPWCFVADAREAVGE